MKLFNCFRKQKEVDGIPVYEYPIITDLPPGIKELLATPCKDWDHKLWSTFSDPYKHWSGSSYTWQARRCLVCGKVEERMI